MSKIWFVTGAARGIGAETVKAALAAGDKVVATGRDAAKVARAFDAAADRLLALKLDVTDRAHAEAAVVAAVKKFGRIDVLVNNAGYGQLGMFEENSPEAVDRQFAVNLFGLFDVTRAVLPVMRRQRAGHIFNITSIGGLRGSEGGSLYCASKFAIEGFSESLAQELAPFGVAVTLIEPGRFRTDFLDPSSIGYGDVAIEDYAERSSELRALYEDANHRQAGDPAKLGALLVDLAARAEPPLRFPVGTDAVQVAAERIERLQAELDAWRDLAATTDGNF